MLYNKLETRWAALHEEDSCVGIGRVWGRSGKLRKEKYDAWDPAPLAELRAGASGKGLRLRRDGMLY